MNLLKYGTVGLKIFFDKFVRNNFTFIEHQIYYFIGRIQSAISPKIMCQIV